MHLLLDLQLQGLQIEKELLMESMQLSLASPEHLFGHDMWYHLLSHFQLAIMLIAAAVCLAGML